MNLNCSNQDPCPVILDSKCVIYEGENLLYIGVNTNDNFRVALQQINTTIGNLILSGGITQLTGDVSAYGPGVAVATLATVNANVGQFGSSTAIPKITVNAKGLVTAISTESVLIPSGSLNFIGDVTGSGNTGSNTTLTLATVNSNIYTSDTFLKFSVNGKGLVTAASAVVSGDITAALGYTPYNASNPAGYISGITSLDVTTALGYTPYNSTNPAGYISSISGIIAGGELAGTYPNPTLVNAAVTAKLLTGVNITGGSIVDTDSILTAFGKVQNQINGLIGGSIYQGVWNAATNTPALTSGVGTKGYYYIVNVPGSTNLDGITDWELGDWAIFDGTAWQQVDNTDAVVSVNGFTGAVSLTTDNVPEGLTNQYFLNSRARQALSGGTGISYDNVTGVITSTITQYTDALARQAISLTTTGTSGAATYNNTTGVLNIPIYTTDLSGYVPIGRTLTINGTSYDLSADRTWTVSGTMPAGGTAGQILAKIDGTDYNTEWIDNYSTQIKVPVKLGAALSKGTPVYTSSADGTNIIVSAASNTSEATSSKTMGLLETGGALNAQVKVVTYGLLAGLDTSAANAAGDPVWLGPGGTLIFGLVNKPYAPAHLVYIGVVTRKQSNNGEIFISVQNGFEMQELHNVSAQNPANNDILAYNTSTSLWEKNTIVGVLGYTPYDSTNPAGYITGITSGMVTTALGYTPVPTTRTLTINGTAYDLSADRSWTVSPSVNATYTQDYTATTGQASFAVTGGYTVGQLAVYYNGSKLAANEYTATNGTSFTLATACQSNDIVQAVASVTGGGMGGSGTTNYIPKFTASGVIGDSLIYDNGTNVGIGTSSPSTIGGYRVLSMLGGAGSILELKAGSGATSLIYSNNVGLNLTAQGSLHMLFLIDFVEKARLNNNGTFSIGNTNSTYNLDVTGTGRFTGTITAGAANGNIRLSGATTDGFIGVNTSTMYLTDWTTAAIGMTINLSTGAATFSGSVETTGAYFLNGNAYFGKASSIFTGGSASDAGIMVAGSNNIIFGNALAERMRITSAGNVGIGTSDPQTILNGFSSSARGLAISNAYPFIGLNDTDGGNFFVGTQANLAYLWNGGTNAMIFATNNTERMRITNAGLLSIGTSNPYFNTPGLLVGGSASSYFGVWQEYSGSSVGLEMTNNAGTLKIQFFGSSGNYYFAGSNISDRRSKSNIQQITEGLSKISQLKPSTFTYDKNPDIVKGGFIAQEVLEVMPEFVTIPEDENEMMGVDYFGILALAVKSIQELKAEIDQLKNK